jgi:hypothetical protein
VTHYDTDRERIYLQFSSFARQFWPFHFGVIGHGPVADNTRRVGYFVNSRAADATDMKIELTGFNFACYGRKE